MRHPFDFDFTDLKAVDLEFEETLTSEESAQVGGGLTYPPIKIKGDRGGKPTSPFPSPMPPIPPIPKCPEPSPYFELTCPIEPPDVTTLAIGEEGGDPIATTMALGEEGGFDW